MIYLKVIFNRYVQLLCISIFLSTASYCQAGSAEQLRDSIESVDWPGTEIALPIYTRINQLSKKEGDRNNELYSMLWISYFNKELGNKIIADEGFEYAYEFAQDTSGINQGNIILAYQLMQDLERRRGNLIRANEINKKYLEFEILDGVNDMQLGISYLEMASGLRILGDLENSKIYSTKSFELFENAADSLFENAPDNVPGRNYHLYKSLQFRGLALKDLQNYSEAIQDYKNSLGYLKKSAFLNKPIGIKANIDGLNRISDAYLLNGDIEAASESLNKLSILFKNESYERYRFQELSAVLALKKGDYSSSSKNIKKAIELAKIQLKDNKSYPTIARLYMIYGDYYVAKDSISNALIKYQEGLQYFDANLDDNFGNNPNIALVPEGIQPLQLLNKKAEALMSLYEISGNKINLQHCISTYNAVIALMDKMKSDFINEGSKYRVNDFASETFPKALNASYTLYQLEKDKSVLNTIFKIIEKNKAEILFQNISSKYNLLTSTLPQELIDKGIDLKYNISYYNKALSEEKLKENSSEEKIAKYGDKLFKLNEALTFHDQKIKDNHPDFYKFKNDFSQQITIADLQNILTDEEVLIEYFQTKQQLYTLTISKSNAEIKKTLLKDVESKVLSFYQNITNPPTSSKSDLGELMNVSKELADILISSSPDFITGFTKIIIVPDGILNKIPFEPFIINEEGNLLIEQCNVSYNYSANQFFENSRAEILKDPLVLSLAPKFEGDASEQRKCNNTILGELPYAKQEFDFIKSKFEGKFFEGTYANSDSLISNISDYPIIHLATHACVNEENPMLSQIHFSNGALTNFEIQNLNSRPELVMLSACNTASGKVREGEGVIGLSRGFFEAGVKSVQSSLWSINDKSSSEIVINVYRNLKSGMSKSEALRSAKLDYLSTADKLRSHPYYWAALIHIGNDNPLEFNTTYWKYGLLGFLLISIILISLGLLKRRN